MENFPWKSMEFHGGFSHGLLNYGHAKVTSPTYIGVKEMFACTAQDLAT